MQSESKSKKRKGKTIYKELNSFSIPDDIKKKADEIYGQMKIKVRRGQPRLQMIFACICYAYRELKIPHNQRKISKIIGLDIDKISEAFKLYSYIETGYKPKVYRQTYKDHIPLLYKYTGLSSGEEDNILRIAEKVIENDKLLLEKNPICLAGALVIYYMEMRGLPESSEIMEDIGFTHATVYNMVSMVANAYNN